MAARRLQGRRIIAFARPLVPRPTAAPKSRSLESDWLNLVRWLGLKIVLPCANANSAAHQRCNHQSDYLDHENTIDFCPGAAQGLKIAYQLIDLDRTGEGVEALPSLLRTARALGFAGLNITFL